MKKDMGKTAEGGTEKKIISEIVEKVQAYESGMGTFLSEVAEWAGLFKVLKPARKRNAYSNPRLTEFFRASNALATMMYRMMTSADPNFNIKPLDPDIEFDDLDTLTHVFKAQNKAADYNSDLLRSCLYVVPFGTVIAQEDYRIVGVSSFGHRVPTTTLTPRVLDQVAFDRGTIDIRNADWISTADVISSAALLAMARENDEIDGAWNKKALETAANMTEGQNTMNLQVLARLSRANASAQETLNKNRELIFYTGKLDAMNDGVEYVAALINRKILVRFHANNFQHGLRNFRVAKWVDFDQPLGLGLGQLLAPAHRSMDANRQKLIDSISMMAYSMWQRKKDGPATAEFVIRPNQIVDVDGIGDIAPLEQSGRGAEAALKLEEILKQEFRNASGATDTLQAIVTNATASEVSLAQNEGMRNISVKAERAAEELVRRHLEVLHANNIQNVRAPFNINKAGLAKRVYPSQLSFAVDIEAKVTTDRDFKPQRLEKLVNLVQILTSTKSEHPDQASISILPLIKEIAYMLDVNPNDVIMRPGQTPVLSDPSLAGMGAATIPGPMGPGGGDPNVVGTPVGPVMASP